MTLIPLGYAQNALSPVVGDKAREFIESLTKGLTPEIIAGLVEKDISLWSGCIPEGARQQLKELIRHHIEWMNLVRNGDLVLWVYEARPDLEPVLSTSPGKKWFNSLLYEIRNELGR